MLVFCGMLTLTGKGGSYGPLTASVISNLILPFFLSTCAALAAMLRLGTWPGTAVVLVAAGVIQYSAVERLDAFHRFSEYGSPYWLTSKLVAAGIALTLGAWTVCC